MAFVQRLQSIKWRAAFGAAVFAVVLVVVASAVQLEAMRRDLGASIAARQSALVGQAARDIDDKLSTATEMVAKLSAALPPDVVARVDVLEALLRTRPELYVLFDTFVVMNLDGRVVSAFPKGKGLVGIDSSDRPYFRRIIDGGVPLVSEPYRGRASGEPIVTIAAPLRSAGGEIIGVLVAAIRLQSSGFLANLANSKVGTSGYFFLLSRGPDPLYIVHPERSRILQHRPQNGTPGTTRALEGFEGTIEDTNTRNVRALLSYRRLETTGWLLGATLPTSEAFAPIDSARDRSIAMAAVVALVVAPVAWFLAWYTIAPLAALCERMRALRSTHDPFVDVGIRRRDEIGELASTFNALMRGREEARALLVESEARLRSIADNLPSLICYIDRDRRYRFNNRTYRRWLRRPLAEITGKRLDELYGPAIHAELLPHLERAFGGTAARFGFHYEGFAGRRHVRGVYVPDRDASGAVRGVYGLAGDDTRLKRAEEALERSRRLLEVTLDSIGDAVITTDVRGRVQWMNPVAERLTGWSKAEARGRALAEVFTIVHEDTRMPAPDPVALCLAEERTAGLARHTVLVSRDGRDCAIEDSAAPIRDGGGAALGAVLVFHDVSEQRRLSREITHRATHDPLTGLVNRSEFEARLQRVLDSVRQENACNGLLYVDLDQFKLVNDACGHAVGDQLLREVSAILCDCVRSRDTVARLGGDEFGVIVERCNAQHARSIAQKICDRMETFRFQHDGRRFRVGASIGLVDVDRRWADMAAILQAADTACYAAKEAGRNRVHVYFDADGAVKARRGEMQWVGELERALDEHRFVLYFQRIVPMAGTPAAGDGLHCELLLRLRSADGSIVLPSAFLPAAERFNMATRIDRWVVRQAFSWMERAATEDRAIEMVAINLSGRSIGDKAFHADAREMIARARFDVSRVCFEITETAAIDNLRDAKVFIDEMRAT